MAGSSRNGQVTIELALCAFLIAGVFLLVATLAKSASETLEDSRFSDVRGSR